MFEILPVNVDGLSWNARVNFTKSKAVVTEQADDQIIYGGTTSTTLGGNAAIQGQPLGVIVGSRIERDDNGNYVVNASGNYGIESVMAIDANGNEVPLGTEGSRTITPIIGNPEPDYVMNFINTLKYKNFTLGWQLSHTAGGDIVAKTVATLLGRGGIVEDRKNTFILPGAVSYTHLTLPTSDLV